MPPRLFQKEGVIPFVKPGRETRVMDQAFAAIVTLGLVTCGEVDMPAVLV